MDARDPGSAAGVRAPGPQARPEHIPLSYAQRRMWFLNQYEPDSAAYVIPIVVRLHGRVDIAAMRAATNDLVERHEVLRTVYPTVDETRDEDGPATAEPRQLILGGHPDLVHVGNNTLVADVLDAEIATTLTTPFDVTRDSPLRAPILSTSDHDHVLVMALHHIAADGSRRRSCASSPRPTPRAGKARRRPGHRFRCSTPISPSGNGSGLANPPIRRRRWHGSSPSGSTGCGACPTCCRCRPTGARSGTGPARGDDTVVVARADGHPGRRAAGKRATLFMVVHAAVAATLS